MGRRLGRPKATVVLRGRTLAERAVDLLGTRCDRVVVVSRADVPLPSLSVPVVLDGAGARGPMNALATGLGHLEDDDVLVLACDIPFAAPLLDALAGAPAGAVAGIDGQGRVQPLCARYPRQATLDACRRLLARGVRRMTALLEELGAATIPATSDELFNVNTEGDLAAARLRPPPA